MRGSFHSFPLCFLLTLIFPFGALAQGDWCGSDEVKERTIQKMGEKRWDQKYEEATQGASRASTDTIPVVVHVLHEGGSGNISYDQIKDGIRVLNEDFNRNNSDTDETRPVFDTLAANSKIHFRLARYSPDSSCTNGVTRTYTSLTGNADDAVKDLVRWPTDHYLNFWLANSLKNSGGNTLLGYAQFPYSGIDEDYGIVMRNDRFGTIGTSNSTGRTATHEVGHCLGLFHTFQTDGCGGDCSSTGDQICDTPPSDVNTFGCDENQNTCSTDMLGPSPFSSDVVDQIENYMSYDACQNMFSKGQKSTMKAVLNNVTGLQTLTSSQNLEATGVHENPLCKAAFDQDQRIVCAGDSVQFFDRSFHGIQKRNWTFFGAAPFFGQGSSSPKTSYPNPGLYDVELEVHQGSDSLSVKKEDLIRVLEPVGDTLPYREDMEIDPIANETVFPRQGFNGIQWVHTDRTGASGTSSLLLENYLAPPGKSYSFETRTIDASNDSAVALSFKVAYRKKEPSDQDKLKVYASEGCGAPWDLRKTINSYELSNGPPQSSYYKAESANWKKYQVVNPLSFGYNVEGLRFKFTFESEGGNNIYIDDINVVKPSALSVEQEKAPLDVEVFPNPAENELFYRVKDEASFSYSLKDASGRTLISEEMPKNSGGERHRIDVKGLSAGLYFLHFHRDDRADLIRKVILR